MHATTRAHLSASASTAPDGQFARSAAPSCHPGPARSRMDFAMPGPVKVRAVERNPATRVSPSSSSAGPSCFGAAAIGSAGPSPSALSPTSNAEPFSRARCPARNVDRELFDRASGTSAPRQSHDTSRACEDSGGRIPPPPASSSDRFVSSRDSPIDAIATEDLRQRQEQISGAGDHLHTPIRSEPARQNSPRSGASCAHLRIAAD